MLKVQIKSNRLLKSPIFCHSRPCLYRGKLAPAKAGSASPESVKNTGCLLPQE
jgi:hypothetical protein